MTPDSVPDTYPKVHCPKCNTTQARTLIRSARSSTFYAEPAAWSGAFPIGARRAGLTERSGAPSAECDLSAFERARQLHEHQRALRPEATEPLLLVQR